MTTNELKIAVYANYEKYRDIQRLNNAQVASAAGIPVSTISDWKAGLYLPKIDKLMAIAEVLGITLAELVDVKEG